MSIFYRFNMEFKIKDSELPESAKSSSVKNALYAAVYEEFFGASENIKYKHLSSLAKFSKLNEFASNWLKEKGYT